MTKLVIPSKAIAKLEGETQHRLRDGHARKNMVDEKRGALVHTTTSARSDRSRAPCRKTLLSDRYRSRCIGSSQTRVQARGSERSAETHA